MTNLEKFKKTITSDNLCDVINCDVCPVWKNCKDYKTPCFVRLKKWAERDAKQGAK